MYMKRRKIASMRGCDRASIAVEVVPRDVQARSRPGRIGDRNAQMEGMEFGFSLYVCSADECVEEMV